jgi:hypothetical protein
VIKQKDEPVLRVLVHGIGGGDGTLGEGLQSLAAGNCRCYFWPASNYTFAVCSYTDH